MFAVDRERLKTKEEIEEERTQDIVNLYQDKKEKDAIIKKEKTLFDELWEKEHPEEAKKIKQKEEAELLAKQKKEKEQK